MFFIFYIWSYLSAHFLDIGIPEIQFWDFIFFLSWLLDIKISMLNHAIPPVIGLEHNFLKILTSFIDYICIITLTSTWNIMSKMNKYGCLKHSQMVECYISVLEANKVITTNTCNCRGHSGNPCFLSHCFLRGLDYNYFHLRLNQKLVFKTRKKKYY